MSMLLLARREGGGAFSVMRLRQLSRFDALGILECHAAMPSLQGGIHGALTPWSRGTLRSSFRGATEFSCAICFPSNLTVRLA